MKRNIMVIGAYSPLTDAVRKQIEDAGKEIVIVQSEPERGITINGIGYEEIEQVHHRNGYGRLLTEVMIMSAMMSPNSTRSNKAPMPNVNIIEEFELIQLKKSNLSKSQRDWVVKQFNKRFKVKE